MIEIIKNIVHDVANTVWTSIKDVFSSSSGVLVALVIAIILGVFPTWILVFGAVVLFAGIIYTKYQETLDNISN